MPRNAWPVGRNMKRFLLNRWVWPIVSAVAALAFLNAPARGLFVAAGLAQETDLQSQLNTADQVLAEMSKTTGLPIKTRLQKQILGRPAIEKYLKANLRAEYAPEELHVQE